MPAIPTGSPPVALTPVPAHEFGPRSHPGSSQANRDPLVYASTNAQASSHGHGVTGLASTSPTPFPTPNPHSLRGTVRCPPNRDFVPWRFSDAGLSGARTVCVCQHPKTCTRTDVPTVRVKSRRRSSSRPQVPLLSAIPSVLAEQVFLRGSRRHDPPRHDLSKPGR